MPLGGGPLSAVIIGASAGGPQAIESVLSALPADFPVPIAVCQHMMEGTTGLWAERLNRVCELKVVEAQNRRAVRGRHRLHRASGAAHAHPGHASRVPIVSLERDFADVMHVPSIDFLMSSAATLFGGRVLGVLLTGMGSDGALGMLAIRRAGGVTLAQSEDSAFMPSMPMAADRARRRGRGRAARTHGARSSPIGSRAASSAARSRRPRRAREIAGAPAPSA